MNVHITSKNEKVQSVQNLSVVQFLIRLTMKVCKPEDFKKQSMTKPKRKKKKNPQETALLISSISHAMFMLKQCLQAIITPLLSKKKKKQLSHPKKSPKGA